MKTEKMQVDGHMSQGPRRPPMWPNAAQPSRIHHTIRLGTRRQETLISMQQPRGCAVQGTQQALNKCVPLVSPQRPPA